MAAPAEIRRQIVHVAVGGFAFALGALTWWQAALAASAAILMNRFLLPSAMPGIVRGEEARGWASGLVLYPIAVLGLILVFPARLDLAAAAWLILAAGDGAATLVGAHVRSATLPWNARKTAAGLMAFFICGGAGATAALFWTTTSTAPAMWLASMALAATALAAFVETAPIALDDNLSVPAAAAFALWTMQWIEPSLMVERWPALLAALPMAAGVNVLVAAAGWAARTVTVPGAVTGAVIGTVIAIGAGWGGWGLLIAAFIVASAVTKAGHARKAAAGIAEARGGRRGPANAIANTGVAAWAALAAIGVADVTLALAALTAALVTGASDTVASEAGKAWGRRTRLVVGFRRVSPGTSGAISLEGTVAGVAAAAALSATAWALGLISGPAIVIVTVAATLASLVEGALGATLESSGILDNDALNLINTLMGAGMALALLPLF